MVLRAVAVGVASLLAVACARPGARSVLAPTDVVVEGVSGDLAPAAVDVAPDRVGSWKPREEVEVEWHGSWWPAVVLEKRGGERWLVRYEGYDEDWDEVVGSDRIRERRAELQPQERDEPGDDPDP
jgi:hypothetical protein